MTVETNAVAAGMAGRRKRAGDEGLGPATDALVEYYTRMWPHVRPWISDRPLAVAWRERYTPGHAYFRLSAPRKVPPGVRVEEVRAGKQAKRMLVGGDLPTLLFTVTEGALAYHPWHSREGHLTEQDYAVLDLDPGTESTFDDVVRVARVVMEVADAYGAAAAAKTSGQRGMHVYFPLVAGTRPEQAMEIARRIAGDVAIRAKGLATVEHAVAARPPRAVYVDFLMSRRSMNVAGVYSVRRGGTVSTPLSWNEVKPGLDPSAFTIDTVPDRVARLGDLWAEAMGG